MAETAKFVQKAPGAEYLRFKLAAGAKQGQVRAAAAQLGPALRSGVAANSTQADALQRALADQQLRAGQLEEALNQAASQTAFLERELADCREAQRQTNAEAQALRKQTEDAVLALQTKLQKDLESKVAARERECELQLQEARNEAGALRQHARELQRQLEGATLTYREMNERLEAERGNSRTLQSQVAQLLSASQIDANAPTDAFKALSEKATRLELENELYRQQVAALTALRSEQFTQSSALLAGMQNIQKAVSALKPNEVK